MPSCPKCGAVFSAKGAAYVFLKGICVKCGSPVRFTAKSVWLVGGGATSVLALTASRWEPTLGPWLFWPLGVVVVPALFLVALTLLGRLESGSTPPQRFPDRTPLGSVCWWMGSGLLIAFALFGCLMTAGGMLVRCLAITCLALMFIGAMGSMFGKNGIFRKRGD